MQKRKLKNQFMICNKIFAEAIGVKCKVSASATGYFDLLFGENLQNYFQISVYDWHAVHSFKFEGTYEDFIDVLEKVRDTAKLHRVKIESLIELSKEYGEKSDSNGYKQNRNNTN